MKFRKKLNTKQLKFEVEIKFQKFQKEKMKRDFYNPSQYNNFALIALLAAKIWIKEKENKRH